MAFEFEFFSLHPFGKQERISIVPFDFNHSSYIGKLLFYINNNFNLFYYQILYYQKRRIVFAIKISKIARSNFRGRNSLTNYLVRSMFLSRSHLPIDMEETAVRKFVSIPRREMACVREITKK